MEIIIDEEKLVKESIMNQLKEIISNDYWNRLDDLIIEKLDDKEFMEKVLKQAINFVVVKKVDELLKYEIQLILQIIREALNERISNLDIAIKDQIGEIKQIRIGYKVFEEVISKHDFDNLAEKLKSNKFVSRMYLTGKEEINKVPEIEVKESINLKDKTKLTD